MRFEVVIVQTISRFVHNGGREESKRENYIYMIYLNVLQKIKIQASVVDGKVNDLESEKI